MDKKQLEVISRITCIESKIDSIENKIDKILSLLEEPPNTPPKKARTVSKKRDKGKGEPIKKGTCTLSLYRDALLIGGNTFDRRELIKGFGARWNPENKGWTVSNSRLEHVKSELERYFEEVSYITKKKNVDLISKSKNDVSDDNVSFSSGGACDIDSDSD